MDYQSLKNKLDNCTDTQSTLEAIKGVFQCDAEYHQFRRQQAIEKGLSLAANKHQFRYVAACDVVQVIDDFQRGNLEKYKRGIDFVEKTMGGLE